MLSTSERPLFWFGHGVRLAGAVHLLEPFLEKFDVPFVTSWSGKDMIRHDHPRFLGHAGIYGHRAANTAVQNADLIIAVGTRLALPQTGYDLQKFAPRVKLHIVDIDISESAKHGRCYPILRDCKDWMEEFYAENPPYETPDYNRWAMVCRGYLEDMPWLEPQHAHTDYINPYRFLWDLSEWLKPDQVITTDMGTALLAGYPMLRLNGRQRLLTSLGLGEMGSGLPYAIGASIARGKSEVLCLNCDGGMMMNLQELATIRHHQLPIKIIVFCNGGYGMIRNSQDGLGIARTASGLDSMSFPDWTNLCDAFNLRCMWILHPSASKRAMKSFMGSDGASMLLVQTDPNLKFSPKVPTLKDADGKLYSPGLETMQ